MSAPTHADRPQGRRWLTILWPAFLMAGVLEMLVFAFVDPGDLQWFGAAPVQASRLTLYSLAFFAFWALVATSAALTALLDSEHP